MSLSMYDASVPVYRQMLGSLSAVLEKAQAHAAMRGFDPAVLLQSRLYPDMFPLTRQVQIACDAAKNGVARISGVEAPKHEDGDQNLEQLQARIAEVLAFIESVPRERIDGQEERDVVVPLRTRTLQFKGRRFLLHWSLPNFFFHVATAYDILRHDGVELGKADFLGQVDG
jgi:hypothetical protein